MKSLEEIKPGLTLGRYECLLPIAHGGMAAVWAARVRGARGFERIVAVKTMLPKLWEDQNFERMFLDEARIASRVRHPNVVQILDLGEQDDLLYLVMEWVDGAPLTVLLREPGHHRCVPIPIAVRIVQDVCSGLHTAHELCGDDGVSLQLVHRDVSPQNIMVTETGAAKLVDFGVAKAIGRSAAETDAGTLRGKLAYLAPEQLAGTLVDRRVDLFAVGVILYELTTGVHPFRGNSAGATMKNILRRRVPPPSEVTTEPFPDALDDLILRALDREQEFRFQTAADINKALDGVFAGANRATAEDVAAYVRPIIGPSGEQFRRALKQASRRAADSRRDVASIPAQSAQPVEGTPSSGRLMVRSSAPQARHSTGTPAGLPLGREASSVPAAPGTQRDDSAVSVSSDAAIGARGQGTGPSLVEADVAPPVPGDTTAETDSRVVVGGLSRRMAIVLAVAMALLVVAVGALALARFGGQ